LKSSLNWILPAAYGISSDKSEGERVYKTATRASEFPTLADYLKKEKARKNY
jgi:hypothetical protein